MCQSAAMRGNDEVCLIVFCATIYALKVAFVDLVALYTLKYEQLPQYGGNLK